VKRNLRNLAVAVAATTALAPAGVALANGHGHSHHKALWASATGSGTACTLSAPCSLPTALTGAATGQTVHAMAGTYHGGIVISSPVDLDGQKGAVIDATGVPFGIQITGAASGTSVSGFTVENATSIPESTALPMGVPGIGILVGAVPGTAGPAATNVVIAHNTLTNNGLSPDIKPDGTYKTPPGWGVWLSATNHVTVVGNTITKNAGGIYLTDENGPSTKNKILDNWITGNVQQCGIIMAGHVAAVDPVTFAPLGTHGVFNNLVAGNTVKGNGTYAQGGGILMGGGALDAAVYGNVIKGNFASGNGLAGVVVHQHAPGDLNNNVIVDNTLVNNNVAGDPDYGPTVGIATKTADIVIANAAPTPITGTVVTHNHLKKAYFGIWTLNAPAAKNFISIAHNWFAPSITVKISAN